MVDNLVPSQEAREAAADAWRAHSSEQQALEIAAGEHDDWPIVQAFERVIRAARRDEAEQPPMNPAPVNPKIEALVEPVAKAICEASSQSWREGILNGPGMGMRPADPLNNHWRYKARVVLATLAPHIGRLLTDPALAEARQRFADSFTTTVYKDRTFSGAYDHIGFISAFVEGARWQEKEDRK